MTPMTIHTTTAARIVIAEDEAIEAGDLKNMLSHMGYEVCDVAYWANAAIEKVALHRPDCVLMDIKMPGARDGIEAAAEIHRRFGIPVIYVTAYTDEELLARARETGPYGYIVKPFDSRDIHSNIEMALYKHRMEKTLTQEREKYRLLVETMSEAVGMVDTEGHITYINDQGCTLTGYSKEDVLGTRFIDYIAPEYKDIFQHRLRSLEEKPTARYEIGVITRTGDIKYLLVSSKPLKNEYGDITGSFGVLTDITENKRFQEQLTQSENRYRALFEHIHSGVLVCRPRGDDFEIVDINRTASRINRISAADMIGKTLGGTCAPAMQDTLLHTVREVYRSGKAREIPTQYYENECICGWRYYYIYTLPSDEVVIVFTDESAKKRTDEQLKRSLEEKEMLLKEIHHRVKNNMQVISSLLNLQSETIKDPATLAKFRESQYRVKSISLVHEKLYQSEDIERVDFREYLRSLSTYLFQSFGIDPGRIRLELTIDAMQVKIDTLIPCGLILNELITNSLKHAFADGESGTITIAGEKSDHGYTLTYHDDGCGIPAELDPDATETLGMQLIITLIAQLGGTMQLERDNGTTYIITCNRFLQ